MQLIFQAVLQSKRESAPDSLQLSASKSFLTTALKTLLPLFLVLLQPNALTAQVCGQAVTTTSVSDSPGTLITGGAPVAATITVSGADNILTDVNLTTEITHTWNGELDINLVSPSGTTVIISTGNGFNKRNTFNGTVWDDDSTTPVTDASFANNVTATPLVPEGALAAFNGENPNGTWKLNIVDTEPSEDDGELVSWALDLESIASTSTTSYSSISDCPGTFITHGAPIAATLNVSGIGTEIRDVNLTTEIPHNYSSDIDMTLVSPGGTTVKIVTDRGGNKKNVFINTVWDDQATKLVTTGTPSFTPLVPEGALAAFNGEDPNGTWTLNVVDDQAGDNGTLLSWSLDILTCGAALPGPEIDVMDSDGDPIDAGGCNSPDTGNGTDFGSVCVGEMVTMTYTIENNGTGDLELNGTPDAVTVSGTGASHFSTSQPTTATIGSSSETTFSVTYSPSVAGTHIAEISIENNGINKNPYTFNLEGTGLANSCSASNDGPVCPGEDVTLNETGGDAVSWSWSSDGSATFDDHNAQSPVASSAVDGETFTVMVTDGNGCTSSCQTTVTVNTPPSCSATNSGPVCPGEEVTLNETGGDAVSWSWSSDGAAAFDDNAAQSPVASGAVDGETFTVTVTDGNGCTSSCQTTVTVNTPPGCSATNSGPVCPGEDVTLNETGGDAVSWSWSSDGSATFDDNTAQSPVASGAVDGETFTVTVTDGNGCTSSCQTTVTVYPEPAGPTFVQFSNTNCYGDPDVSLRRVRVGPNNFPEPLPDAEVVWVFRSFAPGAGSDVSAHSNGDEFTVASGPNDEFQILNGNDGKTLQVQQFGTGLNGSPIFGTYTFDVYVRNNNTGCNSPVLPNVTKTIVSGNPVITCPADPAPIEWTSVFNTGQVPPNTPQDPSVAPGIYGMATPSNNLGCGVPAISYADTLYGPNPGDCPNLWVLERTWTATDVIGQTDVCVQTFTFTDTTPPAVVTCSASPAPIEWPVDFNTQPVGPNTPQDPSIDPSNYNNIVYSDNSGVVSVEYQDVISGPNPGDCPNLWTVTRTWTVTDACGLSDDCDQVFIFTDTSPPSITCPADPVPIEWSTGFNRSEVPPNTPQDPSVAPDQYGMATATDNNGTPLISYADTLYGPIPGNCPNLWILERTWTATDACGLTDICVQTFTFTDTTDPMITCPNNISVECETDVPPFNPADATATDNCGTPTVDGSQGPLTGGTCSGTVTNTYTATDACGNTHSCDQTITVNDTTPPDVACKDVSVALNSNGEYNLAASEVYDEAGSSDNCSAVLNLVSVSQGYFDCQDEGGNTVTLTAEDDCGNRGTCSAMVTIAEFITNVSAMPTAESCEGAGDGQILVSATAPAGQLQYSIDGGNNFFLNGLFTNVGPGSYDVVVKVSGINGVCEATTMVTVTTGPSPETCYLDSDGDGYGAAGVDSIMACGCPPNYFKAADLSGTANDCDDNDANEHPGQTWYEDIDGDGHSSGIIWLICQRPMGCYTAAELTATSGDCDDSEATTYPGATEICNGIDDDCDGEIDEGTTGGLTWTGNVAFYTQAAVDVFSQCYSNIDGNVIITGTDITDLSNLFNIEEITGSLTIQITGLSSMNGLDNLVEVGGTLTIYYNSSLTTLDGLDVLGTVGGNLSIYYNFTLGDACAIYNLINGGVSGSMSIFLNAVGANSVTEINANCGPSNRAIDPANLDETNAASLSQITKNRTNSRVSIFPNPAIHMATLQLEEAQSAGVVKLVDLTGRTVLKMDIEPGTSRVDLQLTDLKAGTYFVQLKLEDQQLQAEKLIIID
ncbi:MAG: proprotein convertase P-domain-containing protein [Bacteroidota bacterium]